MCLMDCVDDYDSKHIKCSTNSHQSADNPLAESGKLSCITVIEYASQAAAIHAALNQQKFTQGKPAFVGSIKNVELHTSLLSDLSVPLCVQAECVLSTTNGAIYEFSIFAGRLIAKGQINLILPS